ncbi:MULTISPECIES: cell division protein ZapA [Bacillaceae]|uniref:Cell division protein ZapA n=1 Tax=Domibacillus aminovorans TaxID=29332 RepID=A0A177KSQ9_9BACI|nr:MULTISPECIES: cell division protein ZapA [Bacillaceae]OAH56187.1 cell division protein ZapA [Domibacillus aminovorans]OAH62665.1 cell division protein ZapA [Domibacillus aminovorans]
MSDGQKTRLTVDIYGYQYTIVGTESEYHIRRVTEMVDDKMREIGNRNATLDTQKIAVLTAVNMVNDYLKMEEELHEMKMELSRLKNRTAVNG